MSEGVLILEEEANFIMSWSMEESSYDISTAPMTIPELGNSNDLQENTLQGTSADDEVKVELDILK